MAKLWSYSTGRRRLSKVRVYERTAGGNIYIEFTGGKRQGLKDEAGKPVTDHGQAVAVADRLSRLMEEKSVERMRDLLERCT